MIFVVLLKCFHSVAPQQKIKKELLQFSSLQPSTYSTVCTVNRVSSHERVHLTTAKKQYRKFETNIPKKGIARPQSQFPHACVCGRFLYIPIIGLPILLQEKLYVDRSWEYINRSQTHECENWDCTVKKGLPFSRPQPGCH
jgi:hypothetical protein